MARPEYSSNVLQLASDATYAAQGDAYDGTSTKPTSTPALALITQGARPSRQLSARVRNWIDREIAGILAALISDTNARSGAVSAVVFTSTAATTWTAGPSDTRVELVGFGGGGGGGGGSTGAVGTTLAGCGGGGGGGALARRVVVEVTPGVTYEALVGAAGSAGAGSSISGTPGSDGTSGGDTIFRVQGGAELARWPGAREGKGGIPSATSSAGYAPGGSPSVQFRPTSNAAAGTSSIGASWCYGPGFGGEGVSSTANQVPRQGAMSFEGFPGGAGGSFGNSGGSAAPGGGGGGGAAGPAGPGGSGVAGGASGGASGVSVTGAGSPPAANTGAGGGGGGAGGSGTGSAGNGGYGAPGSTGKLTLRVIG